MNLLEAYEACANKFIKEEVEYLQEEFDWPLAQCITHIEFTAEHNNDRKTINSLKRVYIACGRLQPISDEYYDRIQVMNGSKAAMFPKVRGQRYKCVQTDCQFEIANKQFA